MTATATSRVRAEKQAYQSNDESWGTHLNAGVFDIFDDARGQWVTRNLTGNYTLDVQNFISDEARAPMFRFTGTGSFTVTAPAVSYWYIIRNDCTGDLTVTPSGGTGAVIRAGRTAIWTTDGTTAYVLDPRLNEIRAPNAGVSLSNQKIINLANGTDPADAANVGQVTAIVQPFADAAAASASAASASASAANTSALNAATSEANAANSAANLTGTSTTSNSIGAGSRSFTTQAGKFFGVGSRVLITSDGNPAARSMFGVVTAYSGTALTVDVQAIVGSGTFTDWTIRVSGERGAIGPVGSLNIVRSVRTSNTILASADQATLIDVTSGTFTQTFTAAATLGSGWWCYYDNSGTGVVTLDPNASETINGLATLAVHPGQVYLIQCNGTLFTAIMVSGEAVMVVVDERANGTGGGTPTGGVWETRVLNTVRTNTISGASLASNEITLPAGIYEIRATAPASAAGPSHKARLFNVTGAASILLGSSGATNNASITTNSDIAGVFTLASQANVRIEHRTTAGSGNYGVAASFGDPEVYTQVFIRRIG